MSENLGKLTLSDIFNLPYGILVLMVVVIALVTFFFLEKFEGKLYRRPALS
jgi:hypothetical protein